MHNKKLVVQSLRVLDAFSAPQQLVLTLKPNASQQDLLNIQHAVQTDVMKKFGIQLHPEPQ
jgi:UDP-N-acetylenolpyruvoylglucosamine reductase